MKAILFVLFGSYIAFLGCLSAKKPGSPMILQGIAGTVTQVTGNRMPRVGAPLPAPKGIKTTVLVYEPTNTNQAIASETTGLYTSVSTKMVASVQTDSLGNFTLPLDPGKYSVFILIGNSYYANLLDLHNIIAPVTVEPGKLTTLNPVVSIGAVF